MRRVYPHRLTELWHYDDDSKITHLWADKDLRLSPYQLNDIGRFIWVHCDGNTSSEDIAKMLYEDTEGDNSLSDILEDVNSFLSELKDNGLVNWEEHEILDVLLVVPPFPRIYSEKAILTPEFSAPPLGVAYLAASLREHGFSVAILDMHISAKQPEDIIKSYKKYQPRIVGISATTPTFPNSILISKLVKAWDENSFVVMGGVHVTTSPAETIIEKSVDAIIIGEGENTIVDLANAVINNNIKDISNIDGIGFRALSGEIIYTKPRTPVADLDSIPFPARDLLNMDSYYKKGAIVSSRGCPYECNYCSCSALSGHTYRKHSVKYVLDEIEHLIDSYGISYIDFHDDTFNLIPSRVFEFCQEIKKRSLSFTWGCFCRVTNFDYEMASAMKAAGCEVIQFGVEAGNQTVLNSIKKKITLAEVEDAVIAAKKANITKISCGFIIGHALDTEVTANETIDFGIKLAKWGVNGLYLSVLTPYPGTDVYNNLGKNGICLINDDWEQFIFSKVVIETENLSRKKLRELYSKGVYMFIEATNYNN